MLARLMNGDLKNWHDMDENQSDEAYLTELNHTSVSLYIDLWDKRFPDGAGQLKMFLLFSMRKFRQNVAEAYGEDYEDLLAEFYCKNIDFNAKFPEAKNQTFTAEAYGSQDVLEEECLRFKRYVFRNFLGKNVETGVEWTTKDVLLKMLSSDNPSVYEFLP